jgi:hypothetical protein
MLLGLALACGAVAPGAGDAARAYAAVLDDPAAADPAACEGLADPALAADCAVVVAGRRIATGVDPDAACGRVPDGAWRDECRFAAAEATLRAGDPDGAAALCRGVGTFRDACAQHLWDGALAGLWRGDAPTWASTLPAADALYADWDARLGDVTDLDDRFWRHFFRYGFDATGGPPPNADRFCAGFDAARERPCRKAWRVATLARGGSGRGDP